MSGEIFGIFVGLQLVKVLAAVPHHLSSLAVAQFLDLNPPIMNVLFQIVHVFRDHNEAYIDSKFRQLVQDMIEVLPILLNNLLAIVDDDEDRLTLNSLNQLI